MLADADTCYEHEETMTGGSEHIWLLRGRPGFDNESSKQIFPEKELGGHSPNSYIHVSESDLYIPTIGLAYSAAGK